MLFVQIHSTNPDSPMLGPSLGCESLEKFLTKRFRRGRVLASVQLAIDDDMHLKFTNN